MRLCGDRDISDNDVLGAVHSDSHIVFTPRQHIATTSHLQYSRIRLTGQVVISLVRLAACDDLPQKRGWAHTSTRQSETLHSGHADRSSTTGSAMATWSFVGVRMLLTRLDDVSRVSVQQATACVSRIVHHHGCVGNVIYLRNYWSVQTALSELVGSHGRSSLLFSESSNSMGVLGFVCITFHQVS
jgi:hypothetical protein